ncbi:MAG: sensor histidine kinase [Anaerolineae bacterium]
MSRAHRVLDAAALAVDEALTLEDIAATLDAAFADLGWNYALLLKDNDGEQLTPTDGQPDVDASIPARDPSALAEALTRIQGLVERQKAVMIHGQPVLVPGRAADREGPQGTGSIDLPLVVQEQLVGLLSLSPPAWAEEDLQAIAAFARRLAPALRKAQAAEELQQRLVALEESQAQSLQDQKLEAIARLAGGVAHDFNNALTVIRLSIQLIKLRLPPDDRLAEYVRQIEEAGQRAAALTEQLLTFSQHDVADTRLVDLNQVISGLLPMVQHIVGDEIAVVPSLLDGLWPVRLDPSRWDQVIFNLATYARDAMPAGGTLRIQTVNVVVEPSETPAHSGIDRGRYVVLLMSDTGQGLDREVQARLFEPFFKPERASGSGLGLALVHGIVKQNGGQILVSSEPGEGTTFRIYLPRAEAPHA